MSALQPRDEHDAAPPTATPEAPLELLGWQGMSALEHLDRAHVRRSEHSPDVLGIGRAAREDSPSAAEWRPRRSLASEVRAPGPEGAEPFRLRVGLEQPAADQCWVWIDDPGDF